MWPWGCIGLVDYEHGLEEEDEWENHGVVLRLGGEYHFGRIGFEQDNQGAVATSFLYFTCGTEYVQTHMEGGSETPLRPNLTPEERYAERIANGQRFDGFDTLLYTPVMNFDTNQFENPPRPPWVCCVDGFRVFENADLEVLRRTGPKNDRTFEPTFMNDIGVLLDELIMGFLVTAFIPALASVPGDQLPTRLFPNHESARSMDQFCHLKLTTTHVSPPNSGFDRSAVAERLENFVATHDGPPNYVWDTSAVSLDHVCAMKEWILGEILELSRNSATDSQRPCIVPYDIRLSAFYDRELLGLLERSRTFWLPI